MEFLRVGQQVRYYALPMEQVDVLAQVRQRDGVLVAKLSDDARPVLFADLMDAGFDGTTLEEIVICPSSSVDLLALRFSPRSSLWHLGGSPPGLVWHLAPQLPDNKLAESRLYLSTQWRREDGEYCPQSPELLEFSKPIMRYVRKWAPRRPDDGLRVAPRAAAALEQRVVELRSWPR